MYDVGELVVELLVAARDEREHTEAALHACQLIVQRPAHHSNGLELEGLGGCLLELLLKTVHLQFNLIKT